MSKVSDILESKGRALHQIDGDASVLDAVRAMVDANVGSLLVTDGDTIAGIVTERDYLRRVTLEGRDESTTPVGEIMSTPLVVVTPDTAIEECMALMTDRRIRHLPVAEGGKVVAVVSIGDLVKFQSQQQSFEIRYLNDYINSY
jgi:CBS domain-containing protein